MTTIFFILCYDSMTIEIFFRYFVKKNASYFILISTQISPTKAAIPLIQAVIQKKPPGWLGLVEKGVITLNGVK